MSETKAAWTPVKIVLGVVALLVLFVFTTVGFVHFLLTQKQAPPKEQQAGTGPTYALETFNVNLADQDSRHFLKATLTLELDKPGVAKELEKRKAQVRDIIIALLREKKAAELKDGNAAVVGLKGEILERINAVLTNGEVTAVYFTEFIVQ